MRFHGLLVVRDEGDFIAECLGALLEWIDTVHIYDTGSADGTWDLVLDAARRDGRVVPVAREPVFYEDALRAWLFERCRSAFRDGDWVMRLDADEIHHIPGPQFVREHLRPWETRVHCQMYEFVLRESEVSAWPTQPPAGPVADRMRWYWVDPWPELRMFRYRRGMVWTPGKYEPARCGLMARARLPIRHYRCRSPEQAQRRCALRAAMSAARGLPFRHWQVEDWRQWVRADNQPGLLQWTPGQPLTEVHDLSHLPGRRKRVREYLRLASGALRLHDLLAARPRPYTPVPIPAEAQARLADSFEPRLAPLP